MSFVATDPVSHKGKSDIWLTPLSLVKRLTIDPFDLDPCGFKGHNTAKEIWTEHGLDRVWKNKVFLNPPYSNAKPWIEKLLDHGYGVALLFARTDNKYMQELISESQYMQFIKGRISFLRPDGTKGSNAGAASIAFFIGCAPFDQTLGAIK